MSVKEILSSFGGLNFNVPNVKKILVDHGKQTTNRHMTSSLKKKKANFNFCSRRTQCTPLIQGFFNAPYGRCSFSTLAYELAMKTESRKTKKLVWSQAQKPKKGVLSGKLILVNINHAVFVFFVPRLKELNHSFVRLKSTKKWVLHHPVELNQYD